MDVRGLLTEGFGRITELYDDVAEGLDQEQLHHRPDGPATRSAGCCGTWRGCRTTTSPTSRTQPQVWEQWQERVGLPNGTDDVGFGHTSEQVDAIRIADPQLLVDYHHEVTLATARYLGTVDEKELEREVDQRWDPPVTAGVRLISIQGDCLQHLGQAAYVKGLCSAFGVRSDHG